MRFVLRWSFTTAAVSLMVAGVAFIAGQRHLAEKLAAFSLGAWAASSLFLFLALLWLFTEER